ncbi:MAG TPA: DsrE/DsrF/DrsH-like family protein [Planctomycetota bacterium]|nr:DsrE/DsrF/DrsH-like family protein [Planctomycetota bacterium]
MTGLATQEVVDVARDVATDVAARTAASSDLAPALEKNPSASTFVVFSQELDKQLMAFTLANSAAASGMRVTMFFTFWGITALRQRAKKAMPETKSKTLMDRIFAWLLPKDSKRLPLSSLHFMGIGPRLIRWRMRRKGVASLEEQIATARALGVRMVLCDTSVELMGFGRDDFLEGLEVAGATACLEAAATSKVAMVI